MRSFVLPLVTFLALLGCAGRADAGLINGGFELSLGTGWASAGDASTATAAFGVTPTEGSSQALLTTVSFNGDFYTGPSGNDAVSAANLEAFLGLSAGSLGTGFEGSAIKQTFSANAGDVLTFKYNFLTTEGSANDFTFVTLGGLSVLVDVGSGTFSPSLVGLDPIFLTSTRETGWLTFSTTIAATGTYVLGLGVADDGDEFNPSALLVDDVTLTAAPAGGVPEPATFVLLGIGASVFAARGAWSLRKRGR